MWGRSHSALVLGLALIAARVEAAEVQPPRRIAPNEVSRTSAAVVVNGLTALAHTGQILPLDGRGAIIGPGRADEQAAAVLDRLDRVLGRLQSSLDLLVKVDVYVARADVIPAFNAELAR